MADLTNRTIAGRGIVGRSATLVFGAVIGLSVVMGTAPVAADAVSLTGPASSVAAETPHSATAAAPSAPGPLVCGNASLLTGPSTPPVGAVTVPAGDNSAMTLNAPGATYWFAPGVHTLGTGQFSQIIPSSGDTYIGGPGAVIDGQGVNAYAFTQQAQNVTIEYLTIENFVAAEGQGVVNHDSGIGWTVENDTIANTVQGAALMLGSGSVTTDDCLTNNAEYGFDGYSAGGDSNVVLTNSEISYNDAAGMYDQPGGIACGCAGGGKFWETNGATVTGNYIHDNGETGLWVDTDNTGFNISNNYISNNYAEGIMYEVSYNALITANALVDNGWGAGQRSSDFPTGAIYVSESGGDARVGGAYSGQFNITGNVFVDNWGGVVLWENANRFCSDGSDGACTLVSPSVYTEASCGANLSTSAPGGSPDYFDNCRWKTQNVTVSDNTFDFNPSDIGFDCTVASSCGFNALFSEFGSVAPFQGWIVPNNISNNQNNHFTDNVYVGPWHFVYFNQGDVVTAARWTAGITDVQGSGDSFGAQDTGSVFQVYGTDAIGTSIATSQQEYPADGSAKAVVLARSDFFSDALAGGPLAAAVGGPLLLTPGAALSNSIDPRVQAEIQRVLPAGATVYVLGGDLALSVSIDTTLESLGYRVVRVAGDDEYATAVDIAEQLGNPSTVFEATGLSFYDALSAVPAAIEDHAAILLTDGSAQAPETAAYLAQFPGDTRYAIGGTLAASGADPTAISVYGQDLFSTSAAVASRFFPGASIFGAATAQDFPDAMGGGVFMATGGRDGPLLLVNPSAPLPAEITPYLATLPATARGYVFGGPFAVGADVLTALGGAIG